MINPLRDQTLERNTASSSGGGAAPGSNNATNNTNQRADAPVGQIDGPTSGTQNQPRVQNVDINNLPPGWTRTDHNGRTHVRDAQGRIRIRIDPPDGSTPYRHRHNYDEQGRPVDARGNVVDRRSPEAHIPTNPADITPW